MNKDAVIVILSDIILDITDPKITRWKKEQIAAMARPLAKKYVSQLKES